MDDSRRALDGAPDMHGERLTRQGRDRIEIEPGGGAPMTQFGIGKAKSAMGMTGTQVFQVVRGKIDNHQAALRLQHAGRFQAVTAASTLLLSSGRAYMSA